MKKTTLKLFAAELLLTSAGLQTFAQVPVDVIGTLPIAEYNTWIAPPTYNEWGFEPFIAVNPADPSKIVISSLAYNSAFSDGASLWYSTNGGKTWGIRFPIKNPPSGKVPADQVCVQTRGDPTRSACYDILKGAHCLN